MRLISLLCPSRGRPLRFAQMAESALATADDPHAVEILLGLDRDDASAAEYPVIAPVVRVTADDKQTVPQFIERLARAARGDILMTCPDDLLFRTPGWDRLVRARFDAAPGGLLIGYTNDGRDRAKCEHWFAHRRWIEITGHFIRPEFEHFFADQWVEEVARAAGCLHYFQDIVTEHMHFKYGKSEKDETYAAKRREPLTERDRARFAAMHYIRRDEVAKVNAARSEAARAPA